VYVNVRSVGVGRVGICMMCIFVSEEGWDGESVGSETISLLSYTPSGHRAGPDHHFFVLWLYMIVIY
jgi:hypothetical protein